MPHRKAEALSVLIAGSAKLQPQERLAITNELKEVARLRRQAPDNRRNLFQLIHAMRACDSSMAGIVQHHGVTLSASPSMGTYLKAFINIAGIPFNDTHRQYYQRRLVKRRNALMHEAGNYPAGRREVVDLIDLMYGCLSQVL